MNQYCIKPQTIHTGETKNVIVDENGLYFAGYDFMGSVDWEEDVMDAYYMDIDEANDILHDLVTAEDTTEETKRINAGYEIIQSIKTGKDSEIVIGKAVNPERPAQYVCWDCINVDNYSNGGYTMNYRQALAVMAERITNRYDYLPVEF